MTRKSLLTAAFLGCGAGVAMGGAHTWDVNEVFSNADGTIQFIELREANGTPNEVNVAGRPVSSDATGKSFVIPTSVAAPTSNKHILIATAAFAALPGAPTPDHIIPAGSLPFFFSITGDTVRYNPYDAFTFGAVPTDGIMSISDGGVVAANSPTNYAGATGSVNANPTVTPGDWDGDHDLDLADYQYAADCMAGPGATPAPTQSGSTVQKCLTTFDADGDSDVDGRDFLVWQRNMSAS